GTQPGESTNAVVSAVQAAMTAGWPKLGWSLLLVAIVVVIMLVTLKIAPKFPGSLLAIVVTGVLAAALGLPVDVIGELPSGLPAPTLPSVDLQSAAGLVGPALAVAALAAIESLLAARVAASIS